MSILPIFNPFSYKTFAFCIVTSFTYFGNTTSNAGFIYKSLFSLSLFNSIFISTFSFDFVVDKLSLFILNVAYVDASSNCFAVPIVGKLNLSSIF